MYLLLSIFLLLPVLMNFVAKGTSRRCRADTSHSNASSGEEYCGHGNRNFEASHCVADLLDGARRKCVTITQYIKRSPVRACQAGRIGPQLSAKPPARLRIWLHCPPRPVASVALATEAANRSTAFAH
jgi:hypothetical protein